MKKILFVMALGASSCMQADIFNPITGASVLEKGMKVDVRDYTNARSAAAYTALNFGLTKFRVREVAQEKIENRVSNKWMQIVAVQLTRAGIDSTAMAAGALLKDGGHSFTLKNEGKRLAATTGVNTVLAGAENLAQKNSMTKSVVESEIYTSFVRPVAQFFGTNLVLSFIG